MARLDVSAWAIRKPVPSLVLFMVLMALGWFSFQQLPVTRFPNIDLPIVQVVITQSGAAPAELETQVTKRVEDAIAGVPGVKHITSTIVEGSSITLVEFQLEAPVDRAVNDVKDAISRIRAELPRTIDEPITQRLDIEGLPILTYTARAPTLTPEELSWFVDDTVARELQSVKGVSKVERVGGVTREIRVSLDPDRLLALGITAGEVNRQVRATNIDVAGGRGEVGGREQAIRTLAGARTVEDLARTMIALPGGRTVRLDALGTITDTVAEPRLFAAVDGEDVVGFAITRGKGASDVVVAKAVADKIAELQRSHSDIEVKLIDTAVEYTVGVYDSTMTTLVEGAILAILVVFIFLRDLRATIIAAIALPLSIIPTFFAMDAMGFSLNLVSLLAITIVTGILVDDAIVEIENIVRHMRMGKSAYRAALEAADEIGLAVIAITTTIIAVFAPVSFMGGIAGQYFKQFGLAVSAAVFFSLLVARLITPLLAAYFMRAHDTHDEREGWLLRAYTKLVAWSVRHRISTVCLGLVIFAGSIFSMQLIPSGFLPLEDNGRVMLAVELPPGTKLEDTQRLTSDITQRLEQRPDVKSVFVTGGRVLGSGDEVRKATLVIGLVEKSKRQAQSQVEREIGRHIERIPDIRYWFLQENGQRSFQMVVTGRDGPAVNAAAADITSQMKRVPLIALPVSTAELDRPELRVTPDSDLASNVGVSTEAIAEAVRIATIGDVGAALAKFTIGDRQVPIRVQLDEEARANPQIIESLRLQTASGGSVPLSSVATFATSQGPTSIDRYDRLRRVTLGADLVAGASLGEAVEAVNNLPAAKNLAPGLQLKQFGDAEVMEEVFASFGSAMAAGIMMVYAVLVLLFASFLQPITILFSLPLSIGGAIVALIIAQQPISLPVVIGILMLMGIVTKNAIMLVDFAIESMARGVSRQDAIVDAGRKRARPIIMTTIAMCGGMLPSALAFGSGGEFRAPMAAAVIGGLISSTLLSLIFVPAVFVLMDEISGALWRLFSRFVGKADEGEETTAPPHSTPVGRDDVALLPPIERPQAAE
ncbi:efflux RND transporter permease subunit [Leptospira interrogans]